MRSVALQSKADSVGIFLHEFERIDAHDLAVHVQKRAAPIARIDGRVGLDPRTRASRRKFPNRADDSFRDAEKHRIAGFAYGDDSFSLMSCVCICKSERGEILALNFKKGDVEIGIEKNNFGFELRA